MKFKTRKINPNSTIKKNFNSKKSFNLTTLNLQKQTFIIIPLIILLFTFLIINLIQSIDFGHFILSFGQKLKTDQNNHTNILIIGVGGENHDGANLTDSILIANIQYNPLKVHLLSLPRDLYVKTSLGNQRINKVFDSALIKNEKNTFLALKQLNQEIGKIIDLEIHYAIKIDFNGFIKLVDALGGVQILVETPIYDPKYPKDGTIFYETFQLKAGLQQLDGKTALKYARSRKSTSDFDRSKRQQKLITALKEKALSLNILTNPNAIKKIYDSLKTSIDTTLSFSEIIELTKIANELENNKIYSRVYNNDASTCGGILYTPPQELFGGAYFVLPVGKDYEELIKFKNLYFNGAEKQSTNTPIQVFNGTKTPGIAKNLLDQLNRNCFNAISFNNATNRDLINTTIYHTLDSENNPPPELELIKNLIPTTKIIPQIPEEYQSNKLQSPNQIIIEIGADHKEILPTDPFKNIIQQPATKKPSTPTSTSTQPTDLTDTTEIKTLPEITETTIEEQPTENIIIPSEINQTPKTILDPPNKEI